jgi:hypothetical protein
MPSETELVTFLDELDLAARNAISREQSRYATIELTRVRSLVAGFRARLELADGEASVSQSGN